MKTKTELRTEIRTRLLAMSADEIRAGSERIVAGIEAHAAWQSARCVCAFLPMAREPQIQSLWLRKDGPAFCFPRIGNDRLEIFRIGDRALLHLADWKFAHPDFAVAPLVELAEIDLILVPGLAFTGDGGRLGRGGGHYDRLLSECPPNVVKLGLCFSTQILDDLPAEPHDQRVDAVIIDDI